MSDCTEPNRAACPRLCQDFCNEAEEAKKRIGLFGIREDSPFTDAIIETEITSAAPTMTIGGTLEMKLGKLCLRRGDEIVMLRSGKYKITRCWLPPYKHPWNTDFYAITP